jgi:hypothetical protein
MNMSKPNRAGSPMPMAPSRQMPMPTTAPQSAAMPMPMQASRGRMMNMGGKVAGYKNGGLRYVWPWW